MCMDITKPLRRKIKIKPPGGEALTLECKYERLPTFCFVCGRLGHAERFCPSQFETQSDEVERAYGPELRAGGRRSQSSEIKWLFEDFPSKIPQAAGDDPTDREQQPEVAQQPRYEDEPRQNEHEHAFCPMVQGQQGDVHGYGAANINEQVRSINVPMLGARLEVTGQVPVMGFLVSEQTRKRSADECSGPSERPNPDDLMTGLEEPMWVEDLEEMDVPKNGLEAGAGSQARLDQ